MIILRRVMGDCVQGCALFSDSPVGTIVGSIGIFVKNCLDANLLPEYNMSCSENNKIDNL